MLEHGVRYLQIAFNDSLASAIGIIPSLPGSDRILLEAGTPFIKREGARGIAGIASLWGKGVVADLKTIDGALGEVALAKAAGASAATVAGSAPSETIDLFVKACDELDVHSMIDMIGVEDPLSVLRKLRKPPDVVVLHKGRDEETTRGKVIGYRHVKRIKSKYEVMISAAGGVDLKEARSAVFNGADIVVVNIVSPGSPWAGIRMGEDVAGMAGKFLETIE